MCLCNNEVDLKTKATPPGKSAGVTLNSDPIEKWLPG